nr:hypothetical protein L204_01484 [Cryptococcus depauperatus CBS 7855]
MAFDQSQEALPSLAAALADSDTHQTIQIAPELMGDSTNTSMAPRDPGNHHSSEALSASHQAFGNYQNSSARNHGYRDSWATGPNHSTRTQIPWEEGYRDHPSQSGAPHNQAYVYHDHTGASIMAHDNSQQKLIRKRARQTKSRDRNGVDEHGLPEDGVLDFGHPSGNFKLGPVFIHPPKGAAQACVRCHKIKRKCDGGKPRCAGCSKADVACVFEINSATSNYVNSLKNENMNLATQVLTSTERISQLESLLLQSGQEIPPPLQSIENVNIAAALSVVGEKAREAMAREEHDREYPEKRLQDNSLQAGVKRRRMSW